MDLKNVAIIFSLVFFCLGSMAEEKKSSDMENNEIAKKIKDIYFRDQKGELLEDILDKEIEKRRKEWVKENIKKKESKKKKNSEKNLDKKSSEKSKKYISRLERWKKEQKGQNSKGE
jgi:type III secretory pathway component EscR